MDRDRYKRNLDIGDVAITKRTAYRYRINVSESENPHENITTSQELNTLEEQQVLNPVLNNENENIMPCFEYEGVIEDSPMADNDESAIDNYIRTLLLSKTVNAEVANKNYKNLEEFMQSEDFSRKVTTPVDKTVGEIFLMILKYSIYNSLSVTGMTNLFKLINSIFAEPILPDSRHSIDQLLNPQDGVQFHAVCHNCLAYIGKFEEVQSVQSCHTCHINLDLSNPSETSFFIIIDPSKQISNILNTHSDYYDKVMNTTHRPREYISDIYDGNTYKQFINTLSVQDRQNYVTAVFNTDGAQKFKCSQYTINPIFLMLNELPIQDRMKNLITCGLWFHKKKPEMSAFLVPFVDFMNDLANKGIHCNLKGQERIIRLYIICSCVDSVAHAPEQGVKQFNGHYGCNWCLHPGIYAERSMKYPLLEYTPQLRDDKSTVQEMLRADPENPTHGILYPSAFINLKSFKVISGFVPDYLHCCLEGVSKQFSDYYAAQMTDDQVASLDIILNEITPPCQISRFTRSFSRRHLWKAREWENFILYYSIPLLSIILNKRLLDHWVLFVDSLYLLLKNNISIEELNRADEMLHLFVAQSEEYFGIKAMTHNLHQMLHISTSVLNFGPLWAHSTFSFESGNYTLLRAIKSAKGVSQQVARFTHLNQSVIILEDKIYPDACDIVKFYCDDVLNARLNSTYKSSEVTYFGKGSKPNHDMIINLQLSENSSMFHKIVKNNCLYGSYLKPNRRSNNSFAQLQNEMYISICCFIVDNETKKEFTICKIVRTRNCFSNHCRQLQIIEKIEDECIYVQTTDIKTICVSVNINDTNYICSVPNLLHY